MSHYSAKCSKFLKDINSNSDVNTMTLAYVLKLNLQVHCTNIGAHKIDGSNLKTFEIVLASF